MDKITCFHKALRSKQNHRCITFENRMGWYKLKPTLHLVSWVTMNWWFNPTPIAFLFLSGRVLTHHLRANLNQDQSNCIITFDIHLKTAPCILWNKFLHLSNLWQLFIVRIFFFWRITGLPDCSYTWINPGMWWDTRNIWSWSRHSEWNVAHQGFLDNDKVGWASVVL